MTHSFQVRKYGCWGGSSSPALLCLLSAGWPCLSTSLPWAELDGSRETLVMFQWQQGEHIPREALAVWCKVVIVDNYKFCATLGWDDITRRIGCWAVLMFLGHGFSWVCSDMLSSGRGCWCHSAEFMYFALLIKLSRHTSICFNYFISRSDFKTGSHMGEILVEKSLSSRWRGLSTRWDTACHTGTAPHAELLTWEQVTICCRPQKATQSEKQQWLIQ